MAMVHDWHRPDIEQVAPRYINSEALLQVDPDGSLTIKLMDKDGRRLSVALTEAEGDRLAELLWTGRK
jgi:hypothetical protein